MTDRVVDGYEILKQCPVCDNNKTVFHRTIFSSPYMKMIIGGEIPVFMGTMSHFERCTECTSVFQNPRLTEQNTSEFYTSGLYLETLALPMNEIKKDETERAYRITSLLKDHVQTVTRHIDIGAGRGILLEKSKENYGCETSGVDLYGNYVNAINQPGDLLTAVHVLEHCRDPRRELQLYRSLTTRYLLIEVPSVDEETSLRFAHLVLIPAYVLARLIENAGFRTIVQTGGKNTTILAEVKNA